MKPTEEIFQHAIYNNDWRDHPCGSGSTLKNTADVRNNLPLLFKKYNINSMFDCPCGDYSWMSQIEFDKDFTYIGGDIVNKMIQENKIKYPEVEFLYHDILTDPIPKVDVVFIRDLLIHLSDDHIIKLFEKLNHSDIKYVCVSNYTVNTNIKQTTASVRSREYNLHLEPFNIKDCVDFIPEHTDYGYRQLELIQI